MDGSGPNTVNTSVECPTCGRCISSRSAELVDSDGCPFCRDPDEEEDE